MIWKTTERVQNVSALLCQDQDISPILKRLALGSKIYREIEFAQGKNWQVFFGKTRDSEEVLIPYIDNSKPLFRAFPDIWMSVGTIFNLPSHIRENYLEKMRLDNGLRKHELVIIPQFSNNLDITDKANIFVIEQRLAVSELRLEEVA